MYVITKEIWEDTKMFIYNFKEMKLPDIDILRTNIDTELFMIDNQLNTAVENEETIYSCFVNLRKIVSTLIILLYWQISTLLFP